MAGTYLRNDQPRTAFTYPSDDGNAYYIKMEAKYTGASGLTVAADPPAEPKYPNNQKDLRHIYIRTTEDGPTAGRLHSRRVPCNRFTTALLPTIGTIDGLTGWTHGALMGEKVHI